MSKSDSAAKKSFFYMLVKGDFGLVKTFWLLGVVLGIVAIMAMAMMPSMYALTLFMSLYGIFAFTVLIGIWKAAASYQGAKIWGFLARLSAVGGFLALFFAWLGAIEFIFNF